MPVTSGGLLPLPTHALLGFAREEDLSPLFRECLGSGAQRTCRADTADDREEACSGMHHRLSGWRALACWQPLQLQVGPQLQTSPHWHDAAGWAAGFWQPQVHVEPVQTAHAHTFD